MSNVRITPNAGISAENEPPRNWGSFPPPAYERAVPTRGRRSLTPARSLRSGEKSGRTVSAIRRCTDHAERWDFPPRTNHLATGGPSRRPPTAGCAGPHRENWPEVERSLACASLRLVRNPDERCLPFQCTDHAERWRFPPRTNTSQLGVLPAARLRRASCRPEVGPVGPGGGSLACDVAPPEVAWAPCRPSSAFAWRLLRLGERSGV